MSVCSDSHIRKFSAAIAFIQNYNGARLRLLRHGGITGNTLTMTEQTVAAFTPRGNDDEIAYGGSLGDLNNDGRLDIVLAARNDGSRVFVADGAGSYARPESSGAVSGLASSDSRYAHPTSRGKEDSAVYHYMSLSM